MYTKMCGISFLPWMNAAVGVMEPSCDHFQGYVGAGATTGFIRDDGRSRRALIEELSIRMLGWRTEVSR